MRRWAWALAIAGGGAIAAGALYQWLGTRRDRRRYPAPGRRVNGLHLRETGAGSPSVVFESGLAASSLSWTLVQDEVATFARTVSYDRAGLGWSDNSREPRRLHQLVAELRALLRAGEIPAPYLLVGHSYGGMIVRAFAAWHPDEVIGLVLVDPVHPSEWIGIDTDRLRTLRLGVMLSRRGAWMAQLGLVRFGLALLAGGSSRIATVIARVSSGSGSGVLTRLVGEVQKLPRELWPVVQAQWCNPASFRGMAAYLEALVENAAEVEGLGPPRVPVVTLSARTTTPAARAEWAGFGHHIEAEDCGHWIQFDDPAVVIAAIRGLIERVRDS